MGNKENVTSVSLQKTQRRNIGCLSCKNVQCDQEDMGTDGLAPLVRQNCRKLVADCGMGLSL